MMKKRWWCLATRSGIGAHQCLRDWCYGIVRARGHEDKVGEYTHGSLSGELKTSGDAEDDIS